MKVHVIEDDKELQGAAQYFLKHNTFEVSVSSDGKTAVAETLASGPDAVLLDIMLPGKSGYEILEELRKEGFNKPVIVMSNLDMESIDRKRLETSGVRAIFLKVSTKMDDIIQEIILECKPKQASST